MSQRLFVKEMNKLARQFHLKQTRYSNPHGLADKGNHSTAQDIAFLAFQCLKDPVFADIVSKVKYECITYLRTKPTLLDSQINNLEISNT